MQTRAVSLALFLVTVVLAVPRVHAADQNPPDDYLCYMAGTTRNKRLAPISGSRVTLQDRMGTQTFKLRRLASLCNPAGIDGDVVSHANVHLEGITIKKEKTASKFVPVPRLVTDRFGTRTLELKIPTSYFDVTPAVPGTTAPPYFGDDPTTSASEINRFKCYAAALPKGAPKFVPPPPPTVTDDVFPGGQAYVIKKVTEVCFAAAADGAPDDGATRPKALVCYAVKQPKGVKVVRQTVGTHGRTVGARVVGRRKVSALCVLGTVS
ncbi:MAG: hypothetical protein ABIR79_05225 [Candidatus Binatia bacterium]